jgi:hypothetical protein
VPDFPSLVAVIVALPAATAVTRPELDIVATLVLLELQTILRPVRTLLPASRVVAENWAVAPAWRLDVAGDTVTVATGAGAVGLTVIVATAVLPSLVTVI